MQIRSYFVFNPVDRQKNTKTGPKTSLTTPVENCFFLTNIRTLRQAGWLTNKQKSTGKFIYLGHEAPHITGKCIYDMRRRRSRVIVLMRSG